MLAGSETVCPEDFLAAVGRAKYGIEELIGSQTEPGAVKKQMAGLFSWMRSNVDTKNVEDGGFQHALEHQTLS